MLRRVLWIAGLLVALLAAPAVFAGGAAIVTLDRLPEEVRAGETIRLDFVVRQHGVQPVDEFAGVGPVEPYLIASHVESGETVRAVAWKPEGAETGRFAVEATFPLEGSWEWRIEPVPFELMNPFEPLTVLPGVATVQAPANEQTAVDLATVKLALRSLGVVALFGAAALFAIHRREARRGEAVLESR